MRLHRYTKSGIAIFALGVLCALPGFAIMDLDRVVGMWLLDEENGGKAVDASGHERDGNHRGGTEVIEGKFGRGVKLFGAEERIVIPELAAVFPPRSFTITMWLRIDEWRDQQIYSMAAAAGDQFTTFIGADERLIHFHAGDPVLFCTIPTDGPGWVDKWTHFAFVKNFVEDKKERFYALYINGAEFKRCRRVGSELNPADGDFVFGGAGTPFDGAIDELAIFTGTLSEAEIKAIADQGLDLAVLAVDPEGKVTSTWAALKAN